MTNPAAEVELGAVRAALAERLAPQPVVSDPAELAVYCNDVSGLSAPEPLLVATPRSTDDVAAAVRAAAESDVALGVRGGGMSYTLGYAARSPDTLLLDLSQLDEIHEINTSDGYAAVGAGCTWQQLTDALKPLNMQSLLSGPISGSVSTIGGAISQGVPGDLHGLLGLEVITAQGERVITGAAGLADAGGFYRGFGPDLTGLFVGDCGVYGIKTRVWLRIVPRPDGVAFASFAFETLADMVQAMVSVARMGGAVRAFGMDPLKSQTAARVDAREGISTLWQVIKNAPTLGAGLASAARILRAGRNVMADVKWSLHLTTESFSQVDAVAQMDEARIICRRAGVEIEASVPEALYGKPFSIRGFVGLSGERWLPVHAIFPYDQADAVVSRVQSFFADHDDALTAHDIKHSYIVSAASASHWLIEPMFYWRDALTPLHLAHLSARNRERFGAAAENPAARNAVLECRRQLIELFAELGAVHLQLGKVYEYAGRMDPGAAAMAMAIKDVLDPRRRLNRGNLGFD